ncbi:MAG TPA: hypothetical protein VD713_06345, partial [Sphingomonadales bacterium]|nr:hypothetical protein [Sphingomonadales bacterium]
PSPHTPGTAFIVYDNHRRSDMKPYVYRADNYGSRFTSLVTSDIDGYALSIQQDPVDPNLLFLGTEFGLFVSTDGGRNWMKWTAGVPTVSVMDLAIQPRENDLVLGTHGRAVFVIDDYSGLRGLTEADFNSRLKLLSMTNGISYNVQQSPSLRFDGATGYRGPNQPRGVLITFIASGNDLPHPDADKEKARKKTLRENPPAEDAKKVEAKVTVEVRNSEGELVRTFKRDVHQGINRIVWGMEMDGVKQFPGGQPNDDGTRFGGPEVVPGTYEISLKFDDQEATGTVTVSQDPRTSYSAEEVRANTDAALEVVAMTDLAAEALTRLSDVKKDIEALKAIAEKAQEDESEAEGDETADEGGEAEKTPLETFIEDADNALKRIGEIQEHFNGPENPKGFIDTSQQITNYIGTAGFYAGSTWDAPSGTTRGAIEVAKTRLDEGIADVNAFLAGDVENLR